MTEPARRRGFLAAWADALAPKPIPENDTGPLKAPKSVVAATILAMIGGIVYLFWGGYILFNLDALMELGRSDYLEHVAKCNAEVSGIGEAIAADATGDIADACRAVPTLTDSDWQGVRLANQVLASIFLGLGSLLAVAAWNLRRGAIWARRTLVTIAVIIVGAAFLLSLSSPIILLGTLLVLIAVIMCYLSSGATFFLRVKARKG